MGESVRQAAADQIKDVIAKFGQGPLSPTAIHETRKMLKRLRSLLSLVRHGVPPEALRREKDRLRAIAHSLASARDGHVMIATASALENGGMPRLARPAARSVMKLLQERREEGEARHSAGPVDLPVAELRRVRAGLQALPLGALTLADVLKSFTETYRGGRRLAGEVFEADVEDERFHDLRKQVQQHWRHLQLIANAWPKALRPQIALARELSETLGKDHDIALLAELARERGRHEPGKRFDAYVAFCVDEQMKLRRDARLLARRLYAEKPRALRHKIKVWWETGVEGAPHAEAADETVSKADALPAQPMLSSA
jgi:CHAD domain-containing protein